jgi:hypothetical protein
VNCTGILALFSWVHQSVCQQSDSILCHVSKNILEPTYIVGIEKKLIIHRTSIVCNCFDYLVIAAHRSAVCVKGRPGKLLVQINGRRTSCAAIPPTTAQVGQNSDLAAGSRSLA